MDQSNRTFIGSVVFVDIVGYTKKSVSDQIVMKDRFTSLLSDSLKDIATDQRIILDTGDGAALSFIGDPEDALFVGMNMRDMLKDVTPGAAEPNDQSTSSSRDLYLRIGINLGPIKLVRDINGQPNIVGDGINVAQRIMSFARPGQVVVSRSYFDVVSVISDEYAQLFKYEGSRTDKHVREHEIYIVGDSAAAFNKAKSGMEDRAAATNPRNRPVQEASKKTAKNAKPNAANMDKHLPLNAARAEVGTDSDTLGSLPLLQNKKKLSGIGAVLAAVVLVLGIMVATKKPATVELAKLNDSAPDTVALTAPSSAVIPAQTPAETQTTDSLSPSSLITNNTASSNPAIGKTPIPAATAAPLSVTTGNAAAGVPSILASTVAPAKASPPVASKTDPLKNDPTKPDPAKASIAQGSISFAIAPWGEILVNGKSIGLSPPVKQHKLAPGKYKIEVRNSNLTPFITSVDVKAKEDLTVRYQFK
jgi:class 3 adenylate cyclase